MGNVHPRWRYELVYWPQDAQPRLELWRVSNGGARFRWLVVAMELVNGALDQDQLLQLLYEGLLRLMEVEKI